MSFLYPGILWFSALIGIPIIIHLFYFRRYKTVYFSQTAFIDEVIKESRSRQRLRNLIILLLRILTILSLVLAFAQPVKKNNNASKPSTSNVFAFYIDNTFSMSNEGERMSLLEEAKSKAIGMIQSLPVNTKYILFYHGMTSSPYPLRSSEEMEKQITNIHLSPITFKWNHVFNTFKKINDASGISSNTIKYVFFSDGQKYALDNAAWEKDSSLVYLFLTSPAKHSNIAIDTVWMEHPNSIEGQTENLTVKVTNYGDDDFKSLPVRLYINDTLKTMATVTVNAHTSTTLNFAYVNLHTGYVNGKVELSDFPVTFDNVYYFNYKVSNHIAVAVISDELSPYFQSFFNSDSIFTVSTFSPKNIPYSTLKQYSFIVVNGLNDLSSGLWSTLLTSIKQGGSVLLISPTKEKILPLNNLLKEAGFSLELMDTAKTFLSIPSMESNFYTGVFTKQEERATMPWVKNGCSIEVAHGLVYDLLLQYENKQYAILKRAIDKGTLYITGFSFSPKITNFMTHPLFVSVLHRMAQLSIKPTLLSYTLSPSMTVSVDADSVINDGVLELKQPKTGWSVIPLQRRLYNEIVLMPQDIITDDGVYQLLYQHKLKTYLSFNYDRKESEQSYYSSEEVKRFLEDKGRKVLTVNATDTDEIKAMVSNEFHGTSYWKWFVLLALLFLIGEMLVIRLWKN